MKDHCIQDLISQLNGVYLLSSMGNEEEARRQLMLMAELLRYKISRRDELVSVNTESSIAEGMMYLHASRFGSNLTTSISIQPGTEEQYIPHYLIMTFVENSFYHGFPGVEGPWVLDVAVTGSSATLHVSISDNGCGFDGEVCRTSDAYGTIGSLLKRLESLYGSSGSLTITRDQGTRVHACIPVT